MAHFATLRTIKVDTRVTFTFHTETKNMRPSKFFYAVGRFMEAWGPYIDDWELNRDCVSELEELWRFKVYLENVPALQYGLSAVTRFIRDAENWERDKDFDKWSFSKIMDLADELANYHFNDFAFWCGYTNPEKLSFEDTGFECEVGCVYVSEMVGFVPIADGESPRFGGEAVAQEQGRFGVHGREPFRRKGRGRGGFERLIKRYDYESK